MAMAEQGGVVKQEPVGNSGNISRRNLLKGAAAAAGLAMAGIGQGARPASAETATPAATATGTSTPDANATKIAGLRTAIAVSEKQNAEKTVIADLERKATALKASPTPTSTTTQTGTPTPIPIVTPTPNSTATEALFIRNRTAVVETATAKAKPDNTFIPASRQAVVSSQPGETKEGGNPLVTAAISVAGVAALGTAAVIGVKKSPGFKGGVNRVLGAISGGKIQIP